MQGKKGHMYFLGVTTPTATTKRQHMWTFRSFMGKLFFAFCRTTTPSGDPAPVEIAAPCGRRPPTPPRQPTRPFHRQPPRISPAGAKGRRSQQARNNRARGAMGGSRGLGDGFGFSSERGAGLARRQSGPRRNRERGGREGGFCGTGAYDPMAAFFSLRP